jgi:glutaredoxin 3
MGSSWVKPTPAGPAQAPIAAASPTDIAEVKSMISADDVVIFASPTCGYCKMAVSLMTGLNIKHNCVYVTPQQRAALYSLSGMRTVPNIWVRGKFIGGYSDGPETWMGLTKVVASGMIKDLLKK